MIEKNIPVYTQELANGKTIVVRNVKVNLMLIDGKWEETWPGDSVRRVERAIERRFPGYFHRFKDGKHAKNCQACKRKPLTNGKFLID